MFDSSWKLIEKIKVIVFNKCNDKEITQQYELDPETTVKEVACVVTGVENYHDAARFFRIDCKSIGVQRDQDSVSIDNMSKSYYKLKDLPALSLPLNIEITLRNSVPDYYKTRLPGVKPFRVFEELPTLDEYISNHQYVADTTKFNELGAALRKCSVHPSVDCQYGLCSLCCGVWCGTSSHCSAHPGNIPPMLSDRAVMQIALWQHRSTDWAVGQALHDMPIVRPYKPLYNIARDLPELLRINTDNKQFRIVFYVLKDLYVCMYSGSAPFKELPASISPARLSHDYSRRPKPLMYIVMHEHLPESAQIDRLRKVTPPIMNLKKPEIVHRLHNRDGVLLVRGTKCTHVQCVNYYGYIRHNSAKCRKKKQNCDFCEKRCHQCQVKFTPDTVFSDRQQTEVFSDSHTIYCEAFRYEGNRYIPLYKVNQFLAEFKTEEECIRLYDEKFFGLSSVLRIQLSFISVPARTVFCTHILPFDLTQIANLNGNPNSTFNCPICATRFKPDQVYVDGFLLAVLKKTNESTIYLRHNGLWSRDPSGTPHTTNESAMLYSPSRSRSRSPSRSRSRSYSPSPSRSRSRSLTRSPRRSPYRGGPYRSPPRKFATTKNFDPPPRRTPPPKRPPSPIRAPPPRHTSPNRASPPRHPSPNRAPTRPPSPRREHARPLTPPPPPRQSPLAPLVPIANEINVLNLFKQIEDLKHKLDQEQRFLEQERDKRIEADKELMLTKALLEVEKNRVAEAVKRIEMEVVMREKSANEAKKELFMSQQREESQNTKILTLEQSLKSVEHKLNLEKNLRYKAEDMRDEAEKKLRESRDRVNTVESNSGLQVKYDAAVAKSNELKYRITSLEDQLKSESLKQRETTSKLEDLASQLKILEEKVETEEKKRLEAEYALKLESQELQKRDIKYLTLVQTDQQLKQTIEKLSAALKSSATIKRQASDNDMKIAKTSETDMKIARKTSETDLNLKRKPSEEDIRTIDKKAKVEPLNTVSPTIPTVSATPTTPASGPAKKFTLNKMKSLTIINQLKDLFPHIDKQLITQTAGEVNNDMDAAIERLQAFKTIEKVPENVNLADHDALKEAYAQLKAMYYSGIVQPKIDSKITAQLKRKVEQLQDDKKSLEDKFLCLVCKEEKIQAVAMPCKHFCLCSGCKTNVKTCPACGKEVTKTQLTKFAY